MSDNSNTIPNTLSLLLVTEAIREFSKHFENMNDKNVHIEDRICNLGKKPGFALVSQLIRNSNASEPEKLEEIGLFLGKNVTHALFSLTARSSVNNYKNIVLQFSNGLPSWFNCIAAPGSTMDAEQTFWFRNYAQFLIGVYLGALTHLGIKATARLEHAVPGSLVISFECVSLEGTWEFSAMQ